MDFLQIQVNRRDKLGTNHNFRLRRDGGVPVVLYGLKKETLPLAMKERDLQGFLKSGNRLVELKLGDVTRTAILREVQYDPISDAVLHVDFVRVDKEQEIEDTVPVIFKGRPKGAGEGGVFQPLRDHVEVRSRPADLPREIVIEVDHLGLHDGIHARDVKLPAGVKLVTPPQALLCVVTTVKVEVVAAPAEGVAAEPELIGKKEAAEEGEEGAAGEKKAEGKPGEKAAPAAAKAEKKPAEKK